MLLTHLGLLPVRRPTAHSFPDNVLGDNLDLDHTGPRVRPETRPGEDPCSPVVLFDQTVLFFFFFSLECPNSPQAYSKVPCHSGAYNETSLKPVALGCLDLRHGMGGEGQGEVFSSVRLTWVSESAGTGHGHNFH